MPFSRKFLLPLVLAAFVLSMAMAGPPAAHAAPSSTKTDDVGGNVAPNTNFHWIIGIAGHGGLVVTAGDTLPAGFTLVSVISNDANVTCTPSGNTLNCSGVPTVDPVLITATVTSPSTCASGIVNTANTSVGLGAFFAPTDTINVVGCPVAPTGLTVTKSHSPAGPTTQGFGFAWITTIVATDAGNNTFVFTDPIPAGFTVGLVAPSIPSTPPCTTTQTVTCTFPTLSGAQNFTVTVNVIAPDACPLFGFDNTSTVTPGSFPAVTSNTDNIQVGGCSPSVTKTDNLVAHNVAPNTAFNWLVNFTDVALVPVSISDTLPAGFTLNSAVSSDPSVTCTVLTNTANCSGTPGVSTPNVTITLAATSPSTCGDATNLAAASIGIAPLSPSDLVHVVGCPVPPTGVSVTKTHSPAGAVLQGTSFDWVSTITATNAGNNTFVFSDPIPAGFTVNTVTPSIASTPPCTTTQTVTCTFPTLSGAQNFTVTINVTAPAACPLFGFDNTSTVTPGAFPAVSSNIDTAQVFGCPSPSVAKTDDVSHLVNALASFHWMVTYSNVAALPITLGDTLPAGFTLNSVVSSDPSVTCTPAGNTANCSGTPPYNVPNVTITMTVTAPNTCQAFLNTAAASVGIGVLGGSDNVTVQNCITTATFTVNKVYTDANTTPVAINVSCTNATPDAASKNAAPGLPAVFNLTAVGAGASCTATEGALPAGYSQSATTCNAVAVVAAGTPSCTITNSPKVVTTATLTVNKVYTNANTTPVAMNASCTNATPDAASKNAAPGAPAVFHLTGVSAGASCTITEGAAPAGYSQSASTCNNVAVVAGGTPSCTITNSPVGGGTAPSVTTTAPATGITTTSATLSGNVTSAGSAPLTARGIVLAPNAVNPAPMIGGTGVVVLTDAASIVGPFSETATGLLPGTNYAFRAFATNSAGTTYGTVVIFTTATQPPPGPAGPKQPLPTPTQSPPVVTKTFNGTNYANVPTVGSPVTLTFKVTNPNATPLTGVGFVDTLPAGSGLTVVPGSTSGSCDAGIVLLTTTTITLAGATLPASGSCTFSVTVLAGTAGSWNNTVTANANGTGFGPPGTATVNVGPMKQPKSG